MSRRLFLWTLTVVIGVAAAAAIATARPEREHRPPPARSPGTPGAGAGRAERPADAPRADHEGTESGAALVLIRRRGGVPERWVRRVRSLRAVVSVTELSRTQPLLRTGVRPGYAAPLDALVVSPAAYAATAPEADRAALRRMRRGEVLLSETSAGLRRRTRGDRLRFASGQSVRIAGVISDETARDAEVVLPRSDVAPRERRNPQVLVATTDVGAVKRAVPDDRLTRVTDLARPGDGVSPRSRLVRPLQLKRRFGEFAVRLPYGADWITIDPGWLRRNIVTRDVPILGAVTCHRRFMGPLRRALTEVRRRGLTRLVDPGDYAGCFAPRRIPGSGNLSLHAWGLAIDLNASRNPQGARPTQSLRLVHIFEAEGFAWGGRWPTAPDGMHFEFHGG